MQFKAVWMKIWQHWTEVGDQSFKNEVLESINFFAVKPTY